MNVAKLGVIYLTLSIWHDVSWDNRYENIIFDMITWQWNQFKHFSHSNCAFRVSRGSGSGLGVVEHVGGWTERIVIDHHKSWQLILKNDLLKRSKLNHMNTPTRSCERQTNNSRHLS